MNNSNIIKGILIGIAVLALITLIAIGLLGGFEEFQVYSCGSGFYFNRSAAITYKIKELGITSEENYFILDDYFVSNEYGTEYKIKGNIFNVGSVYLAKKSEYYNPEIYRFNLDTYDSEILTITPEMSYVEIYSSDPNKEHTLMVNVEKRDFPVDITLENVNIVLAANILKYRKRSGLSQDELAQKLGVTFQAVSKWENAKAAPDIIFLPIESYLPSANGVSLPPIITDSEEEGVKKLGIRSEALCKKPSGIGTVLKLIFAVVFIGLYIFSLWPALFLYAIPKMMHKKMSTDIMFLGTFFTENQKPFQKLQFF